MQPVVETKPAKAARAKPVAAKKPAAKPVSRTPANKGGKVTCTKCGYVGGNARGCGTAHETQTKAAKASASDDSEDEPGAVPADVIREATTASRRARNLVPIEERVIPHAELVAMLAAERDVAVAGEAGGFVARAVRAPSLVGHTDEKREVCMVHGWVGRIAFDRDQHALCRVREGEDCSACGGLRISAGLVNFCERCQGTGIEPPPEVDPVPVAPRVPIVAAPGVTIEPDDHGHRHREAPRAKTIAEKRITLDDLKLGAIENPPVDVERPRVRGECIDGPRPCGFVACRHHLYLDINPENGSIKINFPHIEPHELIESCALDVADRGGVVLDDLGNLLNVTRERARQLEMKAKFAAIAVAKSLRIRPDDVFGFAHAIGGSPEEAA